MHDKTNDRNGPQTATRHEAGFASGHRQRGLSAAQVALAWVLQQPGVLAIAKAGRVEHLQDNFAAAAVTLDADALQRIDQAFPPPQRKSALAMT